MSTIRGFRPTSGRLCCVIALGAATAACGPPDDVAAADPTAWSLGPPPGDGVAMVCFRTREHALGEIQRVREQYLDCTVDGDCVLMNVSTGCDITCASPVNQHGKEALARTLRDVEHAYCADFVGRGCVPSIVQCAPVAALCVGSKCATVLSWTLEPRS